MTHELDALRAFAAISCAPLERINQVKQRLGWIFPWVSSYGSDFNFDFGVSFRKEDIAAGRAVPRSLVPAAAPVSQFCRSSRCGLVKITRRILAALVDQRRGRAIPSRH